MPHIPPCPAGARLSTARAHARRTLVLLLAAVSLCAALPSPAPAQNLFEVFRNFEGPQVHPLAMTPDGTRLLAVNTPSATLSIFQLTSGVPVLTAEVPVGLEPVSARRATTARRGSSTGSPTR